MFVISFFLSALLEAWSCRLPLRSRVNCVFHVTAAAVLFILLLLFPLATSLSSLYFGLCVCGWVGAIA